MIRVVCHIRAMATVTPAAERAVVLDVAAGGDRERLAQSPSQADVLRRDLCAVLARMRREAYPLPSKGTSASS